MIYKKETIQNHISTTEEKYLNKVAKTTNSTDRKAKENEKYPFNHSIAISYVSDFTFNAVIEQCK